MITIKEIIGNKTLDTIDENLWPNIFRLHYCLNYIRKLYAQPMVVSSGFRSLSDHTRIYNDLNAKRIRDGKQPVSVPMGSNHLIAAAVDIADPEKKFQHWLCDNLEICETLDVYLEEFDETPNWVHLQIFPPLSRKRFFKP